MNSMRTMRKQFSLAGVSLKKQIPIIILFLGLVGAANRAKAGGVLSFKLGSSGTFVESPSVMHGTYAFSLINITFDTDVFVDFYNLRLNAIAPTLYRMPLSGFSYDSTSRTATWRIDGQPAQQNERFQAILSGVRDLGGAPLTDGGYTNEFSILTGDVNGDNQVSAADPLIIINHLNQGNPYNPALDINQDGVVSPLDALITISILNASVGTIPLIPPGPFKAVSYDPPAALRISNIGYKDGRITLQFSRLPIGSVVDIRRKGVLSESIWSRVLSVSVTDEMDSITLPILPGSRSEFYQAIIR